MIESRSPDRAPPPEPLAGWRVLVVDDEEDVRTYLLAVLADAGAQIAEASEGREALSVARTFQPDLITLDLSMPGHDGVATFRELRSNPQTSALPICIVTGHPEMRAVIYERPPRPPEGYVDKPVDPERLVSTIHRILELGRRRRRGQRR